MSEAFDRLAKAYAELDALYQKTVLLSGDLHETVTRLQARAEAAEAERDRLAAHLSTLVKYANWQMNEGGRHHPTLVSAVDAARAALSGGES